MLETILKNLPMYLIVGVLAIVGWVLISIDGASPTSATPASNSYCGIIGSDSTDYAWVATGFAYTAESGRQYCRQIHDPNNYVCMINVGQLPTRTETTTETILRRSEAIYTLRHVVWRVVPSSSSFKPSGPYDPYYKNIGSLSRPVWQSSGAHPTPEEQANWDAQFGPELIQVFQPGETVTDLPADNDQRHLRDTQITVPGSYEEVDVDAEVEYVNLVHNGDSVCAPAGALPQYDDLPDLPGAPVYRWKDYTPPVGDGVNEHCLGCLGDASFERNERTGAISTHSDGTNVAHNRFVHSCVSTGMVMTSSGSCGSPSPPEEAEITCTQVSTSTTDGATVTSYYCE